MTKRFNITLAWNLTKAPAPKPKTQKFVVDANTDAQATSKAVQWVYENHGTVGTIIHVIRCEETPIKPTKTVMLD